MVVVGKMEMWRQHLRTQTYVGTIFFILQVLDYDWLDVKVISDKTIESSWQNLW